jgi:hypothetical protein
MSYGVYFYKNVFQFTMFKKSPILTPTVDTKSTIKLPKSLM